jgi:hypothetical protein
MDSVSLSRLIRSLVVRMHLINEDAGHDLVSLPGRATGLMLPRRPTLGSASEGEHGLDRKLDYVI